VDTGLLQEFNIADWAQATNEQHARRLTEHTALKQTIILEVSAKLKLAKTLAARAWLDPWERAR
jgi:hypothetical protein